MENRTFKNGRLTLKSFNAETEKTQSLSLTGLKEEASTDQVQTIRQALDPLMTYPSQAVEASLTYVYH